jgi:1,2-diacylglycerol 3-alpha-glucosyltransferase
MKICMMTNTFLPHVGGVARSVHTFSESLRASGNAVLVVAPTFEGDEKIPTPIERRVIRLPAIQQFNGSDFSVRLPLTWTVNPELNAFKPDIVHSHHPYLLGDSALRYAADKNAPVIFTHHTLHEEYTHYVPFDSPALKEFVIELCTQYSNLCDAVIAPSESIASLIKKRGVKTPIEIIPTGIDLQAFSSGRREKFRRAYNLPPNAFVVGHVGRLAPEKNLDYLAAAVVRFLQEHPNSFFLVIGAGPSADGIHQLFKRENLADRLVMPGKKSGKDLYDAYAAMDVFAFSSFSETQGMVLTEAMAAGLPVVALDASGVREVVRDNKNGFLLNARASQEEFAARLGSIAGDQKLRRRFIAAARRTAEKFSEVISADKAIKLYERVLRQTRRQRAQTEHETFGTLLKRIGVEWSLLTEKAEAALKAVKENRRRKAAC